MEEIMLALKDRATRVCRYSGEDETWAVGGFPREMYELRGVRSLAFTPAFMERVERAIAAYLPVAAAKGDVFFHGEVDALHAVVHYAVKVLHAQQAALRPSGSRTARIFAESWWLSCRDRFHAIDAVL